MAFQTSPVASSTATSRWHSFSLVLPIHPNTHPSLAISSLHVCLKQSPDPVGVVLSRMGLWLFDLAVTQLLQERCTLCVLCVCVCLFLSLCNVTLSSCKIVCLSAAPSDYLTARVPESSLALVCGVQSAMQSVLEMLGYVLGIILSRPSYWNILVSCLLHIV